MGVSRCGRRVVSEGKGGLPPPSPVGWDGWRERHGMAKGRFCSDRFVLFRRVRMRVAFVICY